MCAIAGIINGSVTYEILRKMLDSMQHRGPDDEGVFTLDLCTLLHRRLSVITPEQGKQPMTLSWNGEAYTLVYNGELYNTKDLQSKLSVLGHSFGGNSDTETLLHAYVQWKEETPNYLNGIFAFAVWHHNEKKLFLARDRMGVKPLFYTQKEGVLLFASEIKTLLAHPSISAQLDAQGAAQILLLGPGRIPGSGVFKGIQELEQGCCGVYCDDKWSWYRYWSLKDMDYTMDFASTAETVKELVTDSIKRQTVSDVPLGSLLSGGLDSSVICSVCVKENKNLDEKFKTFSVDYVNNNKFFTPGKFQPNSDHDYIRQMQQYLNTDHHETVLTTEDLLTELESATIARDLPGMADVDFSILALSRKVRKHVKVVLSGECADEIFGGYPWYTDPEVRAFDGFPWAQNSKYRGSYLAPWIKRQINADEFIRDQYQKTLAETDIRPGADAHEIRMKQMMVLNVRWFMQTLLDRKDRMSMATGLEVRVPFCDHRIAELLYTVPWDYKYYKGREKGLLRYAMKDYLPHSVLYRKKSPYPKTFDPHYYELVSERLRTVLADPNAPIFDLVEKNALNNLLAAEYQWPWYGQLMQVPQTIAYMLQINFWLSHYHITIV